MDLSILPGMRWVTGICWMVGSGLLVVGGTEWVGRGLFPARPDLAVDWLVSLGAVAVFAGLVGTLLHVARVIHERRQASVPGEIVLRRVRFDRGVEGGVRFLLDADLALPGRPAVPGRWVADVPHQLSGSTVPGARFWCEARPDDPARVWVQFRPERPTDYVEFMPMEQGVMPDFHR